MSRRAANVTRGGRRAAKSPRGPQLVLASASPRRAELLAEAGYRFRILASPVEEPARRPAGFSVDLWPTALAFLKAYCVQRLLEAPERTTVLGADTIVVLRGRILGKPRDRFHARQMLQHLSGSRHEVITGLALLRGERHRFARAVSICRIRKLSPGWIENYLDTGLWRGKAGAYGIQDHDDPWVRLVEGEWSNVVGLPMQLLVHELAALQAAG